MLTEPTPEEKRELVCMLTDVKIFLDEIIPKLACEVSGRYSGKGCEPESFVETYEKIYVDGDDKYYKLNGIDNRWFYDCPDCGLPRPAELTYCPKCYVNQGDGK